MFTASPHLHVATFNIHKGFSAWNQRLMVRELRDALAELSPDIMFLQEVQGEHSKHAGKYKDWPTPPQHEFLAGEVWSSFAYGRNVVYDHGHHGNAILSRYPIVSSANHDVTDWRFERRGMLHCQIAVPGFHVPVDCVCVHLSLFARSRKRQMAAIVELLEPWKYERAPIVVAGDFNDWANHARLHLATRLGLVEAFGGEHGPPARTFPVSSPRFRLDRIYVGGFRVDHAAVLKDPPWSHLSDHAALSAFLTPTPDHPAP